MNTKFNDIWFYYLKTIKIKVGPLKLDELCDQLISQKIELEQAFFAQSGWPKWKNGLDIPVIVTKYQTLLEEKNNSLPPIEEDCVPPIEEECLPPPVLPMPLGQVFFENKKVIKQQAQPVVPNSKSWTESRKHPRVEMELKAIFVVDKKSFRTKTINLSLGGIKITDPLPDIYFDREIQVFLSSMDLKFSIKFTAKLAGNKSSGNQIQFTSENEAGIKHLEAWLLTMNDKQDQIIKKTA